MSVDGFSMGNIGLTAELSASQIAGQAEHLARKESETIIKDVNQAEKEEGVKRKKDDEENNKQGFDDGFSKNDEESNESEDEQQQIHTLTENDIENQDPKTFSIRINDKTEMVELYNNKSKKTVESMKAEELMDVVLKLDNASGVLVNRKV